jgi:hypothetical protein
MKVQHNVFLNWENNIFNYLIGLCLLSSCSNNGSVYNSIPKEDTSKVKCYSNNSIPLFKGHEFFFWHQQNKKLSIRSPSDMLLMGCYNRGDTIEIRNFVYEWNFSTVNRMPYPYDLNHLKENIDIKLTKDLSKYTFSYSTKQANNYNTEHIALYAHKIDSKDNDSIFIQLHYSGLTKDSNNQKVTILLSLKLRIFDNIMAISNHYDTLRIHKILQSSMLDTIVFFDMTGAHFTKIPPKIKEMKNLKHLGLSGNFLNEDDFSTLVDLQHLEEVELNNCGLTSFPNKLLNIKNLEAIHLSGNKIETIPESIFSKKLKFLDVRFNERLHQFIVPNKNSESMVIRIN